MTGSQDDALAKVAAALRDGERLLRAVGSGRRRGSEVPEPERVELRAVDLRGGRVLQVAARTGPRVSAVNVPYADAEAVARQVDSVLSQPYRNWHVETVAETLQLRVTKKGEVLLHVGAAAARSGVPDRAHDRVKDRLIDPDDPLFTVLGADGDKRRQVDAFLRGADAVLRRAAKAGVLRDGALRVVDLGCGNAYLTLAAHRYLSSARPGTRTVGVELRQDLVDRSTERADRAGLDGLTFMPGTIAGVELAGADVVLALHACDTATDEALARAVRWRAPVILAAPCCHHDVQRQLSDHEGAPGPDPYQLVTRHPILRERLADVLTDALRAQLLRLLGYRVEVVEFVDSTHTPRNALIRAVRTGAPATEQLRTEYEDLVRQWQIRPALADMLAPELELAGVAGSPASAPAVVSPRGQPSSPAR